MERTTKVCVQNLDLTCTTALLFHCSFNYFGSVWYCTGPCISVPPQYGMLTTTIRQSLVSWIEFRPYATETTDTERYKIGSPPSAGSSTTRKFWATTSMTHSPA